MALWVGLPERSLEQEGPGRPGDTAVVLSPRGGGWDRGVCGHLPVCADGRLTPN